MGVEFQDCIRCGESFNDCGDYTSCYKCAQSWCCDKCAKEDGWKGASCNYCTKKELADHDLVKYLLKEVKLTRKQAVAKYFEGK